MRRFQWWIFLTLTAIMYQTRTIAQSDAGTAARSENIRELLGRSVAYREANPIEKIYLHTDKQSYTVGETIWFKAYTVVGNENLLSNISNIAYAELIDPKDQVVASVRIPILQGLGRGDFTLIDTLIEGTYRLRAYTNWMRNDSSTYFFSKNIQISNGRADNILSRSLLTDNGNYAIYLQDLKGIGLADEEIQYTVSRNGKTLRRGRGRTDPMGRVEIPYRENFAGARLSILFNNPAQSVVEKVFKLPNVTVRENSIQFFPEGGHLLTGVLNRIAAKSIRPDGLGIGSMTKIVTTAGDTIAILETNSLGMGSVPLFIEETDTLFAHTVFEDGSYRRTPLPLPTATKYSLEINNMNPHTLFAQLNLSKNWQTGEDVFFVVHYLGKVYYASSQPASKSALVFSVKKNELPNGVLTVSLLNHRLEPLTERPVFIYDQAGILPLSLRVDAGPGEDSSLPSYARRQKVSLSIESGTPLDTIRNAFLSASVINRSKLPEDRPAAQGGIIASLLLSNDVKGYIEDPGFYIDEEGGVKMGAVDDLLMTQGWRKIDFTAIPNKAGEPAVPAFMPEKGISIRGQVRRQFRKASVPNADLVLIPTHNFMQFIDTVANEEGRFAFDRLFFPDSIDFLITARDESGKNNVDIVVEEETSPAVGVNRNAPGERNNVNSLFVDDILNSKRYFSELESQGFMERSITIREVIITARQRENKAAENSSNFNGPGNADQVISASELSSCSTLEMCLNGRLTGVVFQNGVPYNTRTNGPMQLILDGMYIESDELWMIVPDNVESVEVLRSINYTTVYGSYGTNGVIIITSKIGVDASAREHTPKGIVTVQPKGLHVNKTFYKPVYEPDYEVLFDRDLRTTIHWEPNIVTDLSGVAHFDFYTADEPGEYLITVEGLDIHGRPAQKTLMIEVR